MYLVFDVGGTFIKYALMDQKGKIYEKYKVPTPFQDGKVDDNGDEITPYTVKTEDGIAAFLEQIDIIYGKYSKPSGTGECESGYRLWRWQSALS